MAQDTRDKNDYPNHINIEMFRSEYGHKAYMGLQLIDTNELKKAILALATARHKNKKIFTAGNGGSAAISEHLECDFQKGCEVDRKTFLTRSLTANGPLLTAIGNDLGYDQTFKYQLELLNVEPDDVLLLISSSGNSANILEAAKYAQSKEMCVIAMTGFDGGQLRKMADISLHVPFNNYGIVEDVHQMLMHMMAQYLYLKIKDESQILKTSASHHESKQNPDTPLCLKYSDGPEPFEPVLHPDSFGIDQCHMYDASNGSSS